MKKRSDGLGRRITVRISDDDRARLDAEAKRRGGCSEGEVLRTLIREVLGEPAKKKPAALG